MATPNYMKQRSRVDGVPIPWQLKIATKIVCSRLPVDYRLWSKLNLFRHGAMDKPSRAYEIFHKHFYQAKVIAAFTMLELGPGDSLASAIFARASGAKCS